MKKCLYALLICLMGNVLFVPLFAGNVYVSPTISYDSIRPKNSDVRFIGYTPRVALGYGDALNEWLYLAGEVYVNPGSFTYDSTSAGIASLKPQYSLGAGFLPGIILDSDILGYLRLGAISTRFHHYGVTRSGWQLGIGFEAALCRPWTIRGEYVYTAYGSISPIGSPRMDEYTIGLVYRFL